MKALKGHAEKLETYKREHAPAPASIDEAEHIRNTQQAAIDARWTNKVLKFCQNIRRKITR